MYLILIQQDGVESFVYELVRKYKDLDITIVYKTGSREQIKRIKKYTRIVRFTGQQFKCKKAFFNYETDIIDNIEAKEYIQIIHAMLKTQGYNPRIHPKITKYLAVSESASKEYYELTGIKPEVCINPLQLTEEEKKPILWLISATRLTHEKRKKQNRKIRRVVR